MKYKTLHFEKLKIFRGTVSHGKRVVGSFGLPFNTNIFSVQFNIKQLQYEARPEGFVLSGPGLLLQWWDDAIQAETSQRLVEGAQRGLTAASASLPLFFPVAFSTNTRGILCLCSRIATCSHSFVLNVIFF